MVPRAMATGSPRAAMAAAAAARASLLHASRAARAEARGSLFDGPAGIPRHVLPSYPANAGYPVRRGFAVDHRRLFGILDHPPARVMTGVFAANNERNKSAK